jgi:hypothetical protein
MGGMRLPILGNTLLKRFGGGVKPFTADDTTKTADATTKTADATTKTV